MRSEIETLKTWITESDNIVFFGGAGRSEEHTSELQSLV